MAKAPRGRPRTRQGATVKTTVELPEGLWREAKIRAMDERRDLRAVIIEALEMLLKSRK